jgi:hypothetical protein
LLSWLLHSNQIGKHPRGPRGAVGFDRLKS